MCGIIAYVGQQPALPVLLDGLKEVEYRGYDSTGLALLNREQFVVRKAKKVSDLRKLAGDLQTPSAIGIAHTRWATHGSPSQENAHPHLDRRNKIALVHNGLIENYQEIKSRLMAEYEMSFKSETDTEVLAQLTGVLYEKLGDFERAVYTAWLEITGTYGLVFMCSDDPGKLIAIRKGSPLVIGVGDNECVISSDNHAISSFSGEITHLSDDDKVVVFAGEYHRLSV